MSLLLSEQMLMSWRCPLKHGPNTIGLLFRNSKWILALEILHGKGKKTHLFPHRESKNSPGLLL